MHKKFKSLLKVAQVGKSRTKLCAQESASRACERNHFSTPYRGIDLGK